MDLTYQRCPEDDAKIITATLGMSNEGREIELGIAEIAASLSLKGAIYSMTLAIKGGVQSDFVSKVAAGLISQMGDDRHALCPILGVLIEAIALSSGGYSALDGNGLVNIYPSKDCPPWMKEYFKQLVEEE